MDEFDQFWAAYPRKVAKIAARRAFLKAKRLEGVTIEDLLAGVQRYIATKPDYADWCHPTTFLNGGRWMDEPDAAPEKAEMVEVDEETYFAHLRATGREGFIKVARSYPTMKRTVPREWLDERLREAASAKDHRENVVQIRAS